MAENVKQASEADNSFFANLMGGNKPPAETATTENIEADKPVDVVGDNTASVVNENVKDLIETTEPTNYDAVMAEKLGYNTVQDFLNSDAIEKVKTFDNINSEYNRLKQENQELLSEFSTVDNPFAHESVLKLNMLLKSNPDMNPNVAMKLISADFNSMDNIQKIMLAEQISNPDFTEKEIKRSLVKKFGVDSFDDLHSSDLADDIADDISIEGKRALKVLSKFNIQDIKAESKYVPDKIQEKINQRIEAQKVNIQEIERQWMKPVQEIETSFREFNIPISKTENGQKTSDVYTKLVLTDGERKQAANLALEIAKANNFKTYDQTTQKFVSEAIYNAVLMNKLPEIIKLAVDKATNAEFQRLKAERDGVPPSQKKDVSDKGNPKVDMVTHIKNSAPPKTDWKSSYGK